MPIGGREKSSFACVRDGVTVDCGTSGSFRMGKYKVRYKFMDNRSRLGAVRGSMIEILSRYSFIRG
jgi:hypothetical protein